MRPARSWPARLLVRLLRDSRTNGASHRMGQPACRGEATTRARETVKILEWLQRQRAALHLIVDVSDRPVRSEYRLTQLATESYFRPRPDWAVGDRIFPPASSIRPDHRTAGNACKNRCEVWPKQRPVRSAQVPKARSRTLTAA